MAPTGTERIIYQITLPSGAIITNPAGFGETLPTPAYVGTVVTEDGRVLAVNEDQAHQDEETKAS